MEHTQTGGLVHLPKSHQDKVFVEKWAKVESDAQTVEKEGGKTVKGKRLQPSAFPPKSSDFSLSERHINAAQFPEKTDFSIGLMC